MGRVTPTLLVPKKHLEQKVSMTGSVHASVPHHKSALCFFGHGGGDLHLGLPESSQLTFLTYIIEFIIKYVLPRDINGKEKKVRRVHIGLTENFDDLNADQRGSLTRRGKTSPGLRHGGIGNRGHMAIHIVHV